MKVVRDVGLGLVIVATGCAAVPPRTSASPIEPSSAPVAAAPSKVEAPAEPVQAAGTFGPGAGGSLISASIDLSNEDRGSDSSDTSLTTQVGGGYFITPIHEVGGSIITDITHSESGSGANKSKNDSQLIFIAPYYNYNWRVTSRTWYYGGPHAGLLYFHLKDQSPGQSTNDFNYTSFEYGLHVGLRQWVTPTAALFVEPRFTQYRDSENSETVNRIEVLVGFSVTF